LLETFFSSKAEEIRMALSKETARKIIEVVAADPSCRNSIEPFPALGIVNPGSDLLLRFSHLAGSVRNIPWVAKNIIEGKTPEQDPEMTAKICVGIAFNTFEAIRKAIGQGKLPEVYAAGVGQRVHWGVHHQATSIRTQDRSEYIFDWHATLKIHDPAISKVDDWVIAQKAINYVLFSGFN
jgi:hypothetical protein